MTSKKRFFVWTEEMETAFQNFKKALKSPPVLTNLDFESSFLVETDAFFVAAVVAPSQKKQDGKVPRVKYISRTMNLAKQKSSACEREAPGTISALKKYRVYLLSGKPFVVLSDQQAMRAALARKDIYGQLTRWLNFLAEYEFEFFY